MNAEIICVGTEILLGNIVNTNAAFIASRLSGLGIACYNQCVVGDNMDRVIAQLAVSSERSDIVILCGGLGPTEDDMTKEAVAAFTKRRLIEDAESRRAIERFFENRGKTPTDNNWKQALLPKGAKAVPNANGTAPGIILETRKCKYILLPGPPVEMESMFDTGIVPYLKELGNGTIFSQTVKIVGIGESRAESMIIDLIDGQTNPTIALYARHGDILVRLTAKAPSAAEADALIARLQYNIEAVIGRYVYGYDEDSLPEVLGKELLKQQKWIAFAESCTGGLATSLMTDVPGSSAYVKGSVVSYTEAVKNGLLAVSKTDLERKGAVSPEVARQMAEGVREKLGTDLGVSVTGLAGPGGGTKKKPVGLVYMAVADADGTVCREFHFSGSRTQIKLRAAMAAIGLAFDRAKGLLKPTAEDEKATQQSREKKARKAEREARKQKRLQAGGGEK